MVLYWLYKDSEFRGLYQETMESTLDNHYRLLVELSEVSAELASLQQIKALYRWVACGWGISHDRWGISHEAFIPFR